MLRHRVMQPLSTSGLSELMTALASMVSYLGAWSCYVRLFRGHQACESLPPGNLPSPTETHRSIPNQNQPTNRMNKRKPTNQPHKTPNYPRGSEAVAVASWLRIRIRKNDSRSNSLELRVRGDAHHREQHVPPLHTLPNCDAMRAEDRSRVQRCKRAQPQAPSDLSPRLSFAKSRAKQSRVK
jgi:hypothetical protein